MQRAAAAAVLVVVLAAARADETADAAAAALRAFRAGDSAALKALAEKRAPDPWLVADELCARGERDAAAAFAGAAPRADTENLARYVATAEAAPAPALLALSKALAAKGEPAEVLAALDGVEAAGVVGIRIEGARGSALEKLKRDAESGASYLRGAEAAERLGWLSRAADLFERSALGAYFGGDPRGALARWERRLAVETARGDRARIAATLGSLGAVHHALGAGDESIAFHLKALAIKEELGDTKELAITLMDLGTACHARRQPEEAVAYYERALPLLEEPGHVLQTLMMLGSLHKGLGNHERALGYLERARDACTGEDRVPLAQILLGLGQVHVRLADYPRAIECYRKAQSLCEELGHQQGLAIVLYNLADAQWQMSDNRAALDLHERALGIRQGLGDRGGEAASLGALGGVHFRLGNHAKALDFYERALAIEEARKDAHGAALQLQNLGAVHMELEDHARALACLRRALPLLEQAGDHAGAATALGNIGSVQLHLGAYDEALDCLERAHARNTELGLRRAAARDIQNLGALEKKRGNNEAALHRYGRALVLLEQLHDRFGVALVLGNISDIHDSQGNDRDALECALRALAKAEEIEAAKVAVRSLSRIVRARIALGEHEDAVAAAREALAWMPRLKGGLAEEQGARAGERFADVYENGALAAAALGSPADVCLFLESARAGTLLEALGDRDALAAATIPEPLRAAEDLARTAERAAVLRYRNALASGVRGAITDRRAELDRAQADVREATERIQREAKAAAAVVYPVADSLDAIRGSLSEGEALVHYGLFESEALALVASREEARIVRLGPRPRIDGALEALRPDDAGWDPARADGARALLVDALRLGPGVRRLLIVPDGALAGVPFALLAGDRTVAYLPSGTTFRALMGERDARGRGVLAFGDPAAASLPRLPDARLEAKEVGDTVLVGEDASAAALRAALAPERRWRAVHFACHALVDPAQPLLSALALSPFGGDDGLLPARDIFGLRLRADLVVLSACDTAKGRAYRAEGVVGFTRAFMVAGAPRVVLSLWNVDDAATRALMARFYELWKPGEMPIAKALAAAQEHVRSQEKWRHPRYWAAWQLWGLAE